MREPWRLSKSYASPVSLPPSFSEVLGPDCPEVLGPDCSRIDKQKSVFYVEYCHYRSERTIEAK